MCNCRRAGPLRSKTPPAVAQPNAVTLNLQRQASDMSFEMAPVGRRGTTPTQARMPATAVSLVSTLMICTLLCLGASAMELTEISQTSVSTKSTRFFLVPPFDRRNFSPLMPDGRFLQGNSAIIPAPDASVNASIAIFVSNENRVPDQPLEVYFTPNNVTTAEVLVGLATDIERDCQKPASQMSCRGNWIVPPSLPLLPASNNPTGCPLVYGDIPPNVANPDLQQYSICNGMLLSTINCNVSSALEDAYDLSLSSGIYQDYSCVRLKGVPGNNCGAGGLLRLYFVSSKGDAIPAVLYTPAFAKIPFYGSDIDQTFCFKIAAPPSFTPSPTITATTSRSYSSTPSISFSSSITPSISFSNSPTRTSTVSISFSPTNSLTASETGSVPPSPTSSPSGVSSTPTPTSTLSRSYSATATLSRSYSATATVSRSFSQTAAVTPTRSVSRWLMPMPLCKPTHRSWQQKEKEVTLRGEISARSWMARGLQTIKLLTMPLRSRTH
jgi:hypothetical protein